MNIGSTSFEKLTSFVVVVGVGGGVGPGPGAAGGGVGTTAGNEAIGRPGSEAT
ncbi:MAG: hypothetical protein Q7T05_08575 [Dehalococcoidia bacterium]|nr:hypothetical protein [Dehalococcoidia bacterium]